jgi:cytochrome c oxidase subunit II
MLAIFFQALAQGLTEYRVTDIFKPMGSPAQSEKEIAYLVFAITGAIFIVVAGLIVYTLFRFRRRPGDDSRQEPPQVYGSNQIEIAWTVIPILIVFVLVGVTARVIAGVENASPPAHTLQVTLVGRQWWWEVQYPGYGFTTANEIHVPANLDGKTATYLKLQSMDVMHSFWIPQVAGKINLIPNRDNFTWIDPREPGVYLGNCAEYCGTQHANMLLRVIAQTPEDFKQWTIAQQKTVENNAQLAQAQATYESLACVNCHSIKGTRSIGKFGPDLTHLMSRQTIGSGVVDNTPENLRAWVKDPQEVKPGCFMPAMNLTDQELDQVMSYLQSLK